MYLDEATLRLQAGELPSREFPRLAAEALAEGRDGETLRAMAALLGEPSEAVRRDALAIRGIELQLLEELGAEPRSRKVALWALVRLRARAIVEHRVPPLEGAAELLATVRDVPDLLAATGRLEGAVEQWGPETRAEILPVIFAEARRIVERSSPVDDDQG